VSACRPGNKCFEGEKERKGKAAKGKNQAFHYPTVRTRLESILKWGVKTAMPLVNVMSLSHKQPD